MTVKPFFFYFFLVFATGLILTQSTEAAENPSHHVIKVHLDPDKKEFSGQDQITVFGAGTIILRLARVFSVKELTVDGKPVALNQSGDVIRVHVGSSGIHVVTVGYMLTLRSVPSHSDSRMLGNILMKREGVLFPESLAWFPRFENREQTYEITIDIPVPGRAVVPGRLVSEDSSEGRYRVTFASEVPAYGIELMAGPYVIRERMHKGIRLRTYFDSSIQDLAEGYLDKTADYLDLYQNWIGAYPFSAFHIVSSPLPVGLGFPNMTYIGTRVLRLPFIRHSSLGHEVLHSWWGNGVYVDYGSGNWAEGLTTFMADYTYVLNQGAEKGRAMRLNWLRDYMALPPERDRPLNKFVGKSHDASQVVGYNKTAFFFHMLRSQLGKAIFDKGIRIFWTRHRFKSAAWDDFRNAFEDASGQKLRVFFDQWLHRTGAPRIGLIRAEAEKKNGGYQVSLSLSQTAPVYNLKVPIEILTSEGTQQFVVSMTDKISRTTFNLIDRPRALAVDPDYDLFRKLDPAETPPILRDVTLGKSAVLILGKSEPFQKAAIILAEQLLDVAPRFLDGGALPDVPLLIVGMKKDVDKYLQAASILPEPAVLAGQGTARVWTGRRGKGQPYLVISADDVRAVSDLNRPLPHYLRQGFLVFSGSKVIKKGEWPAKSGSLKVRFDEY